MGALESSKEDMSICRTFTHTLVHTIFCRLPIVWMTVPDPEEFVDLGRGLELETKSMVFVPVNNATGLLSGGSHW